MHRGIEVIFPEDVDEIVESGILDENPPQHGLLGLRAMRGNTAKKIA
jgi:hypothetical protein